MESSGTPPVAPKGGSKASGRVPELDLLRFIAASAVVFYHFTYQPLIHGVVDSQSFAAVQGVSRFGYLGVNLFFMISGFVILWSSQARTASEFVISRIARLYPSFWVCVLLTSVIVNAGGMGPISPRTTIVNLTMLPSILGAEYVDGVYWTLFIELKFYLLVFIVLITGTMKHVQVWLGVWLACSLVAAAGIAPRWLSSIAMYPFGPYFISGCLLYLMRSRGPSAFRVASLLITCTLAARYAIEQQSGFMSEVTTVSSWVAACAIIVFHAAFTAVALLPRILPDSKWWYWLGSMTYPLYLLHNRIGKTLWAHLPDWMPVAVSFLILFSVIYLLTAVIAAIIERRACSAFQRAMTRFAVRVRSLRSSPA